MRHGFKSVYQSPITAPAKGTTNQNTTQTMTGAMVGLAGSVSRPNNGGINWAITSKSATTPTDAAIRPRNVVPATSKKGQQS